MHVEQLASPIIITVSQAYASAANLVNNSDGKSEKLIKEAGVVFRMGSHRMTKGLYEWGLKPFCHIYHDMRKMLVFMSGMNEIRPQLSVHDFRLLSSNLKMECDGG